MLILTLNSSNLYHHGNHPITTRSLHRHRISAASPSPHPHLPSLTRRSLLLSTALSLPQPPQTATAAATRPAQEPDTTITDRFFIDFSICPTYFRTDRMKPIGQARDAPPCPDSEPVGRVVLGLYGKLVPITVANFKAMCTGPPGSSYKSTPVHKILPGQYFAAGRQGRRDDQDVRPPLGLARNTETVLSRAFMLEHSRPGVVSLCLGENDDDDEAKLDVDYHNVEFLITTGPGPCPQLDGRNVVFGTVLEGLDVVTRIAAVPTYKPAERIKLLNDLAEFIGDDRAQIGRTLWNRPLKTIYISDCGELKDANMSDSSRISPSRCPKNATWIGRSESPISNFSDKTYPEEVDRLSEEEDQLIVDACWSNNSLAAAVGLLFRRLRGRIFDIESVGRHRDEEQSSVYDFNHALAERVSSLATTNCTMWVELA